MKGFIEKEEQGVSLEKKKLKLESGNANKKRGTQTAHPSICINQPNSLVHRQQRRPCTIHNA